MQAWSDAVAEQERARSWGSEHELLASCVELLHAIASELRRGVPVVWVKKQQRREPEPYRVPRPSWITDRDRDGDGESESETVVGPREFFRMLGQ